ncbi:SDR family NAD(P)-dependent oxidoreductase [Paenibacillus albicereus]|uniref:SDR family NAD(P)-dependent oxidoreductase n=1 Tax=Paenibacillus albicereus TaxID=2726185 RepID=A0A6H2GUZ0_9BACL|nr:SDR family NAD(P)-dependent oxidoreductase [Paenibacillus albicereus]QJC50968.1 SDR family NAD(P)-dependent oxidoreductase [Paenibacillus albicereus]
MKHAFITGADRGVGYALALELLRRGYTVFAGRYMPQWQEPEEVPAAWAERLVPIALDVADGESVRAAAAEVARRTDRLDLIVNNAGIAGDKEASAFGEIDYEAMFRLFAVNAVGPLRVVQALSGLLLAGEDKLVVNISSEAGQINQTWREGWYGYCMSKAALNIESNILHNELKPRGGRVLVIHPGWVRSYMGGKLSEEGTFSAAESAAGIASVIDGHLADRTPREHPAFIDNTGAEMSWT